MSKEGTSPHPDVAVILFHHLLERLEALSRDYDRVVLLRACLERRPPAEEILTFLHDQGAIDEPMARGIRQLWIKPGGGVMGDIEDLARERILEAFLQVRPGGPYLSARFIVGLGSSFDALTIKGRDAVYLLILLPYLPAETGTFKREFDPTFVSYLHAAHRRIGEYLEP